MINWDTGTLDVRAMKRKMGVMSGGERRLVTAIAWILDPSKVFGAWGFEPMSVKDMTRELDSGNYQALQEAIRIARSE